MRFSTLVLCLAALTALTPVISAQEGPTEELRRAQFLAAYNRQRAEKRLMAISHLDESKDQRSIETLYFVSVRDPDPEVRSRAFSALVHCEDEYGYTAHLAADSFRQEKEFGVKVEKAVEMSALQYKWAALNELVEFLSTLRWNYWNWHSYARHTGYVAQGNPPMDPPITSGSDSEEKKAAVRENDGYERWKNREPLRWRSENELMGLIGATINRISGTKIEARPRIDQEIVKWWDRKSDLWLEYDRNLRTAKLPKWKDIRFKNPRDLQDDGIQPGKDTLQDLLAEKKEEKAPARVRGVQVDDE